MIEKHKFHLRTYHPKDAQSTWELFYGTIHEINSADYTVDQLYAWAPAEIDLQEWSNRLLKNDFVVVAEQSNFVVGIGSANNTGYLDLLYVHKDYQRNGIATMLVNEIESRLYSTGVDTISTDASITARPFFIKRGYTVLKKQRIACRGVYMTNFRMVKEIKNAL